MHALPYWRLSGYYLFHFAFIGVFLPYFGLYLHNIGFTAWEIGVAMSMMNVMRLFSPSLSGWLADASGRRVLLIRWAALVSLTGFTPFFWWRGYTEIVVTMAVLSFFWSAALPLVETLTFGHLQEASNRYGRIRLWGSVGFILAVSGAGIWLEGRSVDCLPYLIWLLLAAHLLLAFSLPEARAPRFSREVSSMRVLLRQRRVQALLAASFAMAAAHGAFYIFFSIHLEQSGYGKGQVGALWTLGVLAEIVIFLFMPRLLRIFSLRHLLLLCFLAAVVRFMLVGWCMSSLVLAVAAQLLHALTFGVHHVASVATVNRWFAGGAQARGQALYSSLSFGAGGLLGGLLAGGMWDSHGAGGVFTVSSGFALCGLALIFWGVKALESADSGTAPTQMR